MNESVQFLVEWMTQRGYANIELLIIGFSHNPERVISELKTKHWQSFTYEDVFEALSLALAPYITLEYLIERQAKQLATLKQWEVEKAILLEATRYAKK